MSALAVTGIALTTGPVAAVPSPKASPSALAAQAAARLVAARPAAIHASKDDAFIAHKVISTRDGLQYVPYDRTYKGLPVIGGDFVVVTDATGKVLSTSVAQNKVINVGAVATHTPAQAAAAARAHAKYKTLDKVADTHKVIYALSAPRLAYETVVFSHSGAKPSKLHVFTDAATGALVHSYDEVHEGTGTGTWNGPNPLTIDTSHPTSTTWTMTDPIRPNISCRDYTSRAVLSGSDDVWGNGVGTSIETGCVDALYGVQTQWKMLSSWLGRNGVNGSGGGFPIYMGLNDLNAFWNGSSVTIGHNQAGAWISAMDIVGHEFGHAIDNTTPGGIGSSAVAEFTGDVLGTMVEWYANQSSAYDPPDYTIGEEVNLVGSGPIRYMYKPSLAGDPNCYSSSIPTAETHSAAGPGNHWFYLLAEGTNPTNGQPTSTTCNGSTNLIGIGIQTAGKIFYNAMLAKTTSMTYFKYRTATLNAAKNLTPGNCTNFNKVKAAWDAVSVPAQTADPVCSSGTSGPSAGADAAGNQYVFWQGTDGGLWQKLFSASAGAWSGPIRVNQAGTLGSTPAVAVHPTSGEQDVFWKGTDGNLWEAWYAGGTWNGPANLGAGPLGSTPTAGADAAGNAYVFWQGTDGGLWEKWFSASAGLWYGPIRINQAGTLGSTPTVAVHPTSGEQDVFWKGTDGNLWEAWYAGGTWNGPANLGAGPLGSTPTAGADAAGNQYVFWQGTDGGLWEKWFSASAGLWYGPIRINQAGTLGSTPAVAVHPTSGEQDVFWKGTDGNLWEAWYAGGTWNGPANLGAGPLG